MKRDTDKTDGVGSYTPALSGHWDVSSVGMDAETTENALGNIRILERRRNPMEAARQHSDDVNGLRTCTNTSSIYTDM